MVEVKTSASIAEFREALLEKFLAFLWRQWSALGIMGASDTEEDWILDPEPLLVFSLEIGRYEPRLFDEILSWLWANGHRLDTARLKKILLESKLEETARVVGGSLHYIAEAALSRKWKSIIEFGREKFMVYSKEHKPAPLFKLKSGAPHPMAEQKDTDPMFAEFGLNRPRIKNLRQGAEVPVDAQANIRFLLRSLFGVGARSECILYLLTHESGHPSEIADVTGYFWLTIRDALEDLADSKIVLTRSRGKRVEYWLSHKRWWDFIGCAGVEDQPKPKWLHWLAVYAALSQLWRTVDEPAQRQDSEYMTASKLQDSLEILHREFTRAGVDVPTIPGAGLPPDLQQKTAVRFLSRIFGLEYDESSHHA